MTFDSSKRHLLLIFKNTNNLIINYKMHNFVTLLNKSLADL